MKIELTIEKIESCALGMFIDKVQNMQNRTNHHDVLDNVYKVAEEFANIVCRIPEYKVALFPNPTVTVLNWVAETNQEPIPDSLLLY